MVAFSIGILTITATLKGTAAVCNVSSPGRRVQRRIAAYVGSGQQGNRCNRCNRCITHCTSMRTQSGRAAQTGTSESKLWRSCELPVSRRTAQTGTTVV